MSMATLMDSIVKASKQRQQLDSHTELECWQEYYVISRSKIDEKLVVLLCFSSLKQNA
jgi:hypothetical protein